MILEPIICLFTFRKCVAENAGLGFVPTTLTLMLVASFQ